MDWTYIKENIVTILVSIGSSGILTYFLNRFFFEKKFEAYKSNLERKTHISKMRFDLEFSIYAEIAENLLVAYEDCFWLFPFGLDKRPEDDEKATEMYTKRYKTAHDSLFKLQRLLGSKSPFIKAELYNDFMEIKKMISHQLTAYEYVGPIGIYKNSPNEIHRKEETEAWQRTDEITNKHNEIISKMRNYFDKLEIT